MLRVGTDCSGIEAPIQALMKLKIPFTHEFCSDIDKYVIQSIKANYSPKNIYGDITSRDHSRLPDIDLYVAGFPCQPFSTAGSQKGLNDPRANVMFSVIETINIKKPKYFILENVKAFKNNEAFQILLKSIDKSYNIQYKVLNSKDYGIPQNRERLFIVGCLSGDYEFPEPVKMKPLIDFINPDITLKQKQDKTVVYNLNKFKHKIKEGLTVVSTGQFGNVMNELCPTLMTGIRIYILQHERYLTAREHLKLQGFPDDFKQVVSDSQMYRQAGNSMTVDVLAALLKNLYL